MNMLSYACSLMSVLSTKLLEAVNDSSNIMYGIRLTLTLYDLMKSKTLNEQLHTLSQRSFERMMFATIFKPYSHFLRLNRLPKNSFFVCSVNLPFMSYDVVNLRRLNKPLCENMLSTDNSMSKALFV